MNARRKLKNPLTRYRVLRQMYERLFPDPSDRMWALRQTLQMTQAELGEHCGLSGSAIGNVERGYGLPKGTTLQKIVAATGLSSDFLLGVDGKVDRRVATRIDRRLEDAETEMAERNPSARRAAKELAKRIERSAAAYVSA